MANISLSELAAVDIITEAMSKHALPPDFHNACEKAIESLNESMLPVRGKCEKLLSVVMHKLDICTSREEFEIYQELRKNLVKTLNELDKVVK